MIVLKCGSMEMFRLVAMLKCRLVSPGRQGRITFDGKGKGSRIVVPRFVVRFSNRRFFSKYVIYGGLFEATVNI